MQEPRPSTSYDSGTVFASQSQSQSQSILTSQNNTTFVQQTEDESGEEVEEAENPPRRDAATSADAPASTADGRREDVDEDDQVDVEQAVNANLQSSSFVSDEIRNCQHQINVATIALEQLRKVKILCSKII